MDASCRALDAARSFLTIVSDCNAAAGAPIVSEKWVDGSGRTGAFLEARDHLLQDAAAEAKFGFNLAHAWEAAEHGLLLDNTAVFLTPGTPASTAPFSRQQSPCSCALKSCCIVTRQFAANGANYGGCPQDDCFACILNTCLRFFTHLERMCTAAEQSTVCHAGLTAAEADKGEGLRMLITRAGGSVAKTVAQLDSSGTSRVQKPSFISCSTQLTYASRYIGLEHAAVYLRACPVRYRVSCG